MEYQIYKVTEGVTSSMIPADTGRVLDILSKLEASFQGPYTGSIWISSFVDRSWISAPTVSHWNERI